MDKLTKTELKGIVKECLVEILKEGLVNSASVIKESKSNKRRSKTNKRKKSYLDNVTFGSKTQKRKPKIKTNLSSDPVMNSIFADTAKSTLQEQLTSTLSNGDKAAKMAAQHNPEELFGDAASKWSSLAFFDQK